MSPVILVLAGLFVGVSVGLVFFGGLWWTSRRLVTARSPALVVALSLLVRLAVVATALVLMARTDVAMLVAGLAGVVVARMVMTRAALRGRLPEAGDGRLTTDVRRCDG